jgi:hypothetical protein
MMQGRRYSSIYRQLERVEPAARYEVKFADGTRRIMKGIELTLYSMDVSAGIEELGQRGNKTPVIEYRLLLGKKDLSPFMEQTIDEGIQAGKERR